MRIMKKHHGTGSRDYISNLPDDIMSNILSRLETIDAVRTCVLSKGWENKWTSIYVININEESIEEDCWLSFANFVDRVLFKAQKVRQFHFILGTDSAEYYKSDRMETWLDFLLFTRKVEKVKVETHNIITLTRCLSTCTSLIELDIDMPCTWKTPVRLDFPNLTRLCLSKVMIMNVNSKSDTLKFHFPVLKTFEIREHLWFDVKNVELIAPALISFLSENNKSKDSYTIKIIGPSLQNFETAGYYLENFLLTRPTVSYAALKNCYNEDASGEVDDGIVLSGVRVRNLMKQFSSLSSLELTCCLAQALAGTKSGLPLSSFPKLETLALSFGDEYCSGGRIEGIFEGLFELLRSAPVLKSLIIEGFFMLFLDPQDDYDSDMMEPVPSCVVSHLEEFKIECCSGLKQELHLTKYFLEKGTQLKKLSICCVGGKKDEVAEQVYEFPKDSACLTIVIEEKLHPLYELGILC